MLLTHYGYRDLVQNLDSISLLWNYHIQCPSYTQNVVQLAKIQIFLHYLLTSYKNGSNPFTHLPVVYPVVTSSNEENQAAFAPMRRQPKYKPINHPTPIATIKTIATIPRRTAFLIPNQKNPLSLIVHNLLSIHRSLLRRPRLQVSLRESIQPLLHLAKPEVNTPRPLITLDTTHRL